MATISRLAWLDHDAAERARAHRILALFQERAARDELGLGALRDGIADHLFPGTSTIQTRLRYMLFVPWIYRRLEERGVPEGRFAAEARRMELALIPQLKASEDPDGVFGNRAGDSLKRLPSAVYWAGLATWGIRLFPGNQERYHAIAPQLKERRKSLRHAAEDPLEHGRPLATWDDLPPEPPGFAEGISFRLAAEEAAYLRDRISRHCPGSLLADLVNTFGSGEAMAPWLHPRIAEFRPDHRRLIGHAETFSLVMQSAAILYNLLLAELTKAEAHLTRQDANWMAWAEELEHRWQAVASWDLADFFDAAEHPQHTVTPRLREFVSHWLGLLREHGPQVRDVPAARKLVQEREEYLKRGASRFKNHRAREETWGGDAGTRRLLFRWPTVLQFLRDFEEAGA